MRKLAVRVKNGQVKGNLRWVDLDGDPDGEDAPAAGRDPLRPSRAIFIAIPLAIMLWALALGAAGYAVLN